MATKAILQAKIDAIADGQENTALEVRTFANGLLDEIFTQAVNDSNVLNLITSRIYNGIDYKFTFKKVGNSVTVNGVIQCNVATTISVQELVVFTDLDYSSNSNFVQNFSRNNVLFRLTNNAILSASIMPIGDYYIDFTYVTN
jgi:hypothetical protein